jgi:CRISPR-associated protein Cmr1
MRPKPPNFASLKLPDLSEKRNDAVVTETRTYKLITPLFGGGVTPSECDPVTVVSGKNVRGQLRFWWRATRGGTFDGDLAKMKAAEDELWGATAQKGKPKRGQSKVQIQILDVNLGTEENPFEVVQAIKDGKPQFRGDGTKKPKIQARSGVKSHAYAAFPLQPSEKEAEVGMKTKSVRLGVEFTLKISYPESFQKDVHAALWAWETFGGVGARTRRGFGALARTNGELPKSYDVKKYLSDSLKKHVADGVFPAGVPHLVVEQPNATKKRFVLTLAQSSAHAAWEKLIGQLKAFRQSRNAGPGRSDWCEPDEIRRITRQSDERHAKPFVQVQAFPRAAFGLPIIFHFKDTSDPKDTTLQGVSYDRLASPLILRPLACAENKWVGVALILQTERRVAGELLPGGLSLIPKGEPGVHVQWNLNEAQAQRIKPLNGNSDVLQAFLTYLEKI